MEIRSGGARGPRGTRLAVWRAWCAVTSRLTTPGPRAPSLTPSVYTVLRSRIRVLSAFGLRTEPGNFHFSCSLHVVSCSRKNELPGIWPKCPLDTNDSLCLVPRKVVFTPTMSDLREKLRKVRLAGRLDHFCVCRPAVMETQLE